MPCCPRGPFVRFASRAAVLLPVFLPAAAALAAAAPADDTALTIYGAARPGAIAPEFYRPRPGGAAPDAAAVPGFALVRQERSVVLPAGRSQLPFTDVAALIDPTTVTFASLTDTTTRVLEQNFQFDLVSTDKLLQKHVDHALTVERDGAGQAVGGTLLSAADGLVLQGADGSLTALREWQSVRFAALPGGLITRPTLVWDVDSRRAGEQRTRVTYQTAGITWWADYNLTYTPGGDPAAGTLDIAAWVSIVNRSGASYRDARLKLVAGDVHRATPEPGPRAMMVFATAADAGGPAFTEKAFDEYHLYTLGRRTTLPDNSTKQLELFDRAAKVPARRELVYAGGAAGDFGIGPFTDATFGLGGPSKVEAFLVFRNDRAGGLGLPLPAGRLRVSRLDAADGSLEFIGEDVIGHTPRDETVRVKLGAAFDVVGERRQQQFSADTNARWMEEEIQVELRNRKDEPVTVQVRESLARAPNWQVLSSSQPWRRIDARTIVFDAAVPRGATRQVTYRVRYSW